VWVLPGNLHNHKVSADTAHLSLFLTVHVKTLKIMGYRLVLFLIRK
jgi:hypothetical protein